MSVLQQFINEQGFAEPMTPAMYKQRRRVIKFINEAKEIVGEMPRVEVRIVTFHKADVTPLGVAIMEDIYAILIDWKRIADMDDDKLRFVVWHELVHSWFDYSHVEDYDDEEIKEALSPLMHKSVKIVESVWGRTPNKEELSANLVRIITY